MNVITFLTIAAAITFTGVSAIALIYTMGAYDTYKESLQYQGEDHDYYESEFLYTGYLRALFLTCACVIIAVNLWSW